MQFMEPLGLTDSSVEASWDWDADAWRRDFVAATADLAPDVIRYGGLFSRYYKWREGVGPPARRPPMRNYVWGGWERNRVGTARAGGPVPPGRRPAPSLRQLPGRRPALLCQHARGRPHGGRRRGRRLGGLLQRPGQRGAPPRRHARAPRRQALADRQRDILRRRRLHPRRGHRAHDRVRPRHAGARPVDHPDRLGRPRPQRRPLALGRRHGRARGRPRRPDRHPHDAAAPAPAGHGAQQPGLPARAGAGLGGAARALEGHEGPPRRARAGARRCRLQAPDRRHRGPPQPGAAQPQPDPHRVAHRRLPRPRR